MQAVKERCVKERCAFVISIISILHLEGGCSRILNQKEKYEDIFDSKYVCIL